MPFTNYYIVRAGIEFENRCYCGDIASVRLKRRPTAPRATGRDTCATLAIGDAWAGRAKGYTRFSATVLYIYHTHTRTHSHIMYKLYTYLILYTYTMRYKCL